MRVLNTYLPQGTGTGAGARAGLDSCQGMGLVTGDGG